eukprot:CAMPEP_0196654370 /NCGR_PEP_ID=MMETSP1086-20130531/4072_1 /TAXON_ID=77921 /ORGANISM="Cyanoptyche  gloeocystis , Strain SAG4.97" /LENGTH=683 /DNA_ID=CAMNT_0041986093 /DNA_START=152 /DNA_END=2203 /DNA_ORIENTATION=+
MCLGPDFDGSDHVGANQPEIENVARQNPLISFVRALRSSSTGPCAETSDLSGNALSSDLRSRSMKKLFASNGDDTIVPFAPRFVGGYRSVEGPGDINTPIASFYAGFMASSTMTSGGGNKSKPTSYPAVAPSTTTTRGGNKPKRTASRAAASSTTTNHGGDKSKPTVCPAAASMMTNRGGSSWTPRPVRPPSVCLLSMTPQIGPCDPLRPFVSVSLRGIVEEQFMLSQTAANTGQNGNSLHENLWTVTFISRTDRCAATFTYPAKDGTSRLDYHARSEVTTITGRAPLLQPGVYKVVVRPQGATSVIEQPPLRYASGQLLFAEPEDRAIIPRHHLNLIISATPFLFGGLGSLFIRLFLSDGRVMDLVSSSQITLQFDQLGQYVAVAETLFLDTAEILFESPGGRFEAFDNVNRSFSAVTATGQRLWLPTAVDLRHLQQDVIAMRCPVPIQNEHCCNIITRPLRFTIVDHSEDKSTCDFSTLTLSSSDRTDQEREQSRDIINAISQQLRAAAQQQLHGMSPLAGGNLTADILWALFRAFDSGPLEAKFMAQEGANLLSMAAEIGSADLVLKVLSKGVDPLYRGPNGRTALHIAAMHRHTDVLDVLYSMRVSFTVQDDEGRSVADLFPDYYQLGLPSRDSRPVLCSDGSVSTDSDSCSDPDDGSDGSARHAKPNNTNEQREWPVQ